MKFGIYTLLVENHMKKYPEFMFEFGWGQGYVLLPFNHPLYGKDYSVIDINVHGGLTFSDYFNVEHFKEWTKDKELDGDVNLENLENFDKYWMIGFDTNHHGDNLFKCSKSYVKSEVDNMFESCIDDKIVGMKKYKSIYLRKDKLKKLNENKRIRE